jgi:hypothetical protein
LDGIRPAWPPLRPGRLERTGCPASSEETIVPLEELPSAPDVVAVRIEGKLEHEALQRIIDMIERLVPRSKT